MGAPRVAGLGGGWGFLRLEARLSFWAALGKVWGEPSVSCPRVVHSPCFIPPKPSGAVGLGLPLLAPAISAPQPGQVAEGPSLYALSTSPATHRLCDPGMIGLSEAQFPHL